MEITNLALSTSDVDGIMNIEFSSELVTATRTIAGLVTMFWLLYVLKDHVLPSNTPAMGMMGQKSGSSKVLTVIALLIMLEPTLINKVVEGLLKAIITIAGFIPPVRDMFNIESDGSVGGVSTGGYS